MFKIIVGTVSVLIFGLFGLVYWRRGLDILSVSVFLLAVYIASLLKPRVLVPAFSLLIIGTVLGMTTHEYTHYFSSRIWMKKEDVRVNLKGMYVMFDSPYDAPTWGIRVIAGLPYLMMITCVSVYYALYGIPYLSLTSEEPLFIKYAFTGFFSGLGMVMSSSDALGIFFPSRFQEFAVQTEKSDAGGARELLKVAIRDRLNSAT